MALASTNALNGWKAQISGSPINSALAPKAVSDPDG